MLRDSRGYVWIGTQKGLSRYDGARFKVFDRKDFSVDSDYINSLCEDAKGNILIGTDKGIVIYDPVMDNISPLDGISCRVYTMCSVDDGRIFLGVKSEGLYVYDAFDRTISKIKLINPDGQILRDIYRMAVGKNDMMYLAAYCDNLYCVSMNELGASAMASYVTGDPATFDKDDIEGLAVKSRNHSMLYVLSQEKGLVEVNSLASRTRTLVSLSENVFPTNLQYHEGKLRVTSSQQGV
jgi:hypothetical protein